MYDKFDQPWVPEDSVRPEAQTLTIFNRRKGLVGSFKFKSFEFKVIENTGLILHFVFNLALGCTFIEKQPSASVKPVINHGFNFSLFSLTFKLE